ncbi:MAG TPA: ABC transporter permease [Terriglobia bacterium]|nr:ABC transporter permease [Terriglobia bacterium]
MRNRRHVAPAAIALAALAAVLAVAAPGYFAPDNLRDLFLANMPVLIVALGATLVILTGQIDISSGSAFAICSVAAGALAKAGLPAPAAALGACVVGVTLGAVNGALVAYRGIPSIVATLAAMVALRDALRWVTEGAWVQNLPAGFQWFGLTQSSYPLFAFLSVAILVLVVVVGMRHLAAGRWVYATGSNAESARLAGIDTALVTFWAFAAAGVFTGFAAALNAVRFDQIPPNTGLGLELQVIAAVVVGGTAITGGRGSIVGTVLGVALLGAIGPALTFLGVSAYWERAIQGGIILAAVAVEAIRARLQKNGRVLANQS